MSPRRKNVRPDGATIAIFVEGGDDQKMVERLLPPDAPIWMLKLDGSDEAASRRMAEAASKDSGWYAIQTVIVVFDAGEAPDASQARCRDLIERVGFPVPNQLGDVASQGTRRAGYFLVPHDAPGGSETLLLRASRTELVDCVDALFACTGGSVGTIERRDKARAWALAATQPDPAGSKPAPCRPDALWRGVDLEHPAVQPLRAFLAKLTA